LAKKLLVTSSPHYRASHSTTSIMLDVIIAMLPIVAMSVVYFGWRALALTLVSVGSCVAFETLFNVIVKKKNTIGDLSAIVTGMLLSFNLPVAAPYWLAVVGSLFAIVIAKMLFGGIGKNFANPALAARAFLFSWPTLMTTFVKPLLSEQLPIFSDPIFKNGATSEYIDTITTATPLVSLKSGAYPDMSFVDMLIGKMPGCLGEVCTAAILLGGVYLLLRKVISWHIPVAYIGTVALITFLFPLTGGHFDYEFMLYELLSGGLMLGAFFMATDYATSPVTKKGQIIFGIGCGCVTMAIRFLGSYPEGVSFSILLMNLLTPLINRLSYKYYLKGQEKQMNGGK